MDVKNKTVSSRILRYRYHKLLNAGMEPEYIHQCTGISEEEVSDRTARVSYPNYLRFNQFMKLHGLSGLEAEIWNITVDHLVGELGLLPALCVNQPNAGDALNAYIRYRSLLGESDYLSCSQEEGMVTVQFFGETFSQSSPEFYAGTAAANFIILVTIMRWYLEDKTHHFDIELVHDPIFPAEKYQDFFGGEVRFNQEANYMRFDAFLLESENRRHNPALTDFLLAQAEEEYAGLNT
jgi:hypothetical protein